MEKQEIDRFFDRVYDDTYRELCAYVVANVRVVEDAHDVLQNTYLAFYRRLLNGGQVPAHEAIKYLKTAAKHEMGRLFVRRKRQLSFDDESYADILREIAPSELETDVADAALAEQILDYVRRKDTLTYRVFVLFYAVGLTMRETAESLGITPSNAANRLYRTLNELRALFTKEGGSKNFEKGDAYVKR